MKDRLKGHGPFVAFVTATALLLGTLVASNANGSASAVQDLPAADCSSQEEALACIEGLRAYVLAHPDLPLPTTVPPTTVPPTTVPPTTTPPPASDRPSGMPWASGVNPQGQDGANVRAFESMRGKPVDLIVIHPSRDNWDALNSDWAYTEPIPANYLDQGNGKKGHLSFSMPLWPGNGAVGTNYNSQWTAWANRVEALDPKTDVRLGWEMNLPNPWSVNSGNRTAWIAAFNRAATSIKAACPGCTITWNPNWGNDQTNTDSRSVFQAVKANVDIYGIDYYDAWEPVKTAADSVNRRDAFRSLTDSYNYAIANGKRFAIPEWGVACNGSGCQWEGHAGGDNPRYIDHVMDFLRSKPANTIAYDAYFDEPESYIKSNLRAPTVNTNSAAAYRTQVLALAS